MLTLTFTFTFTFTFTLRYVTLRYVAHAAPVPETLSSARLCIMQYELGRGEGVISLCRLST